MIDEFKIQVACFRDGFSDRCTVTMRIARSPLGPVPNPCCEFFNAGFNECQDCRVHLQRIFMDESYRHDPKTVLNPITGDRYPIPEDPRKRR